MNRQILVLLLLVASVLSGHADDRRRKHHQPVPDVPPVAIAIEDTIWPESEDSLLAEGDSLPWEERIRHRLNRLCNGPLSKTSQIGLVVRDLTTGQDIIAHNPRQRMRPASCQKLVTAISALHFLGPGYPVRTELRIDGNITTDSVLQGDVCVVGRMDPLLAQGDVYRMARTLRQAGIKSINGSVVLDISARDSVPFGWGWCWDDKWGPLSALTVNTKDRFAQEFFNDLDQEGIVLGPQGFVQGRCPANSRLLMTVEHTIAQILVRTMKNSDNIHAESVFQQLAMMSGRPWAGRKQAVAQIKQLMQQLNIPDEDYQIADGSGLSLYNYLTPQLLVRLLDYAWSETRIRQALLPTLPVAGSDGTLEKRMRGTPAAGRVMAKTGTVEGISSLAGYVMAPNGHTLAFSIINQGVRTTSQGKTFQDHVCEILSEE